MKSRDATVLYVLVAFRFVNALCVRTFFQPDEYFQALEPAWKIAFGSDSGAWLTWEWQYQLRSSLHPALFGGVYLALHNVLEVLQASPEISASLLVTAPKAIQAVFAALGDYYTWKLALQIYGSSGGIASAALWLTALNPWQWYCSTRTFSNSIETTLTIMALHHWPWSLLRDSSENGKGGMGDSTSSTLRESLLLAATAVVLRPTNLLVWVGILTVAATRFTLDGRSPLDTGSIVSLMVNIIISGLSVLAVSVLADRFYFGFWTFPPYNWLYFNLSQSLSLFYGRNDWHYYLSQGIPLLTTTCLPFVCIGLWKSTGLALVPGLTVSQSNAVKTLSFAVLALVGALSTISHKEVRFIYPLLPILHLIAAPYVYRFFTSHETTSPSAAKNSSPSKPRLRHKYILGGCLAVNIILGGYLSAFHQPAPLSVMHFLRHEYERIHPGSLVLGQATPSSGHMAPLAPTGKGTNTDTDHHPDKELFALFLTPCHSTPWRSHLVYPGLHARALTCEPPIHTEPGTRERDEYLDEADRFYADKAAFLATEMWPQDKDARQLLPRYIVGFEGIEEDLQRFFDRRHGQGAELGVELRRVWEGWNGFFNEDARRRGLLVVWDTGVFSA
ncbi:uncharacterized protein PpBr36_05981 [Pyricularia pennisetigena]|uniref:uncharacterized protein n=1 Tax=Pyricularia pennisetigena TaxID=1578925 RepID=UPI00114E098E|nr:uncharacterized protein PpBr36_05981 [Pyricularia pennisetigena]TLS23262.1 hypothetical protein PpBr36_05981 [Pyricularia pennisetigena]